MSQHSAATQPQPVLDRAKVIAALAVLSALCVKLGLGQVASTLDTYGNVAAGIILAVAPLVTGYLAKRHVTPVASPKDNDGNPLVPASSVQVPDAMPLTADEAEAIALARTAPELS